MPRGQGRVPPAEIHAALAAADGHRAKAAEMLGITERRLYALLADLKAEGQLAEGVAQTFPDGHLIKGVSTLVGQDGSVKAQWIKSMADRESAEKRLLEAVKEVMGANRALPPIRAPKRSPKRSDCLWVGVSGDPHIGLYAWQPEAGEDYDLDKAEADLLGATRRLVESAPDCQTAMLVNVGDFFHADWVRNTTMRSNNALDVDTRWAKVMRTGLRIQRTMIETALEKFNRVHVVNCIGNHDEHTSQMMTMAMSLLYERNKRVTFDESPAYYRYHRFGKVLIGMTHGDTVKPEELGPLMATDRPEDWGKTQYRYWYTGHVHHKRLFELRGCVVESFRTLAAKDAWTAQQGYRSGRDMQGIVLHAEYGEVERHRVDVAQLRKAV